jgi:hypothetical protein
MNTYEWFLNALVNTFRLVPRILTIGREVGFHGGNILISPLGACRLKIHLQFTFAFPYHLKLARGNIYNG